MYQTKPDQYPYTKPNNINPLAGRTATTLQHTKPNQCYLAEDEKNVPSCLWKTASIFPTDHRNDCDDLYDNDDDDDGDGEDDEKNAPDGSRRQNLPSCLLAALAR